jgi:hypothetical protein
LIDDVSIITIYSSIIHYNYLLYVSIPITSNHFFIRDVWINTYIIMVMLKNINIYKHYNTSKGAVPLLHPNSILDEHKLTI